MQIMGDLDNMKIVGPKLAPYSERLRVVCPACGIAAANWWRRFLRKLRGKLPDYVAEMLYCPGDKPPSEEVTGMAAMLMFYGRGEIVNKCSGIPMPHLHCTCKHCHAEWFMNTKERNQ